MRIDRKGRFILQVVLKATKVDGVYNKDPQKHDDVELLHALTYNQVCRVCVQNSWENWYKTRS